MAPFDDEPDPVAPVFPVLGGPTRSVPEPLEPEPVEPEPVALEPLEPVEPGPVVGLVPGKVPGAVVPPGPTFVPPGVGTPPGEGVPPVNGAGLRPPGPLLPGAPAWANQEPESGLARSAPRRDTNRTSVASSFASTAAT